MYSHQRPGAPTRRAHRIRRLALAGALALTATACGDDNEDAAADDQSESGGDSSDDAGTGTDRDTDDSSDEPGDEGGPPAEIAPLVGAPLNPGITTVDFLGTPMTFEVDVPWKIAVAGDGAFVITSPENNDPSGPTMSILRPSGFAAEDELTVEPPALQFSATYEEWLEHSSVTVSSGPTETTIGRQAATATESELVDPAESFQCGPSPSDQCVFWASTLDDEALGHFVAQTGRAQRTWVVDQGEHAPIVISYGALEEDADWLEVFADIVDTIELGEAQPAPGIPVSDAPWEDGRDGPVPAGEELTFPLFGGTTLTMPVEATVFQDGECLLFAVEEDGILIARFTQDAQGNPISTLDDYLAINDSVVTLTETGNTFEFGGATLAEYDFVVRGIEQDPFPTCAPAGDDPTDRMQIGRNPYGSEWIAETEDGIYVIGSATPELDREDAIKALLADVMATLSTTG